MDENMNLVARNHLIVPLNKTTNWWAFLRLRNQGNDIVAIGTTV